MYIFTNHKIKNKYYAYIFVYPSPLLSEFLNQLFRPSGSNNQFEPPLEHSKSQIDIDIRRTQAEFLLGNSLHIEKITMESSGFLPGHPKTHKY